MRPIPVVRKRSSGRVGCNRCASLCIVRSAHRSLWPGYLHGGRLGCRLAAMRPRVPPLAGAHTRPMRGCKFASPVSQHGLANRLARGLVDDTRIASRELVSLEVHSPEVVHWSAALPGCRLRVAKGVPTVCFPGCSVLRCTRRSYHRQPRPNPTARLKPCRLAGDLASDLKTGLRAPRGCTKLGPIGHPLQTARGAVRSSSSITQS